MEYIGSWVFNRGQEITLRKGPKYWHASVYLFNPEGHPFVHIRGRDREKLLLRALELIRKDVAKDGDEVLLLDQYHDHETGLTPFPLRVRTETEELEDFVASPEIRGCVRDIVTEVRIKPLVDDWRLDG